MTRESKLDRHRRAGEPDEKLLETIVGEVSKAAAMPEDDWWALNQFPLQPLLAIPVSEGRMYPATQAAIEAAHTLTRRVWEERVDYCQTIEREAFDRLSFRAIGQAIQAALARRHEEAGDAEGSDDCDPVLHQDLADDFRTILEKLAEEVRTDVDRHIPCTLFREDQLVPAFRVGPVEFLPRADWIDRFVRDQEARSLVDQVERGELTMDVVRQRALEPDSGCALRNAWTAITFLRGFSWVGTIRAVGHEPRQSHRKMSTIVGLAIDAVGLLFHVDDARRLTKAGRAHLFAEDRLATAVDDGRFIHGWSTHVPGLRSAPGELAAKMQADREFLDAAGRILDAYLESRQKGLAPHLVEAWVNALYWFGAARREASDFMAVVKYGCAADGLSGGGGARAIIEFAQAAFAPREVGEPPAGALSIADAVEMVYAKGRSNLAHGDTPGLLEDFSEPRRVGDFLLASLFYVVTLALAEIVADEESPVLGLGKKHAHRWLKERLRARHLRHRSMRARGVGTATRA